MKCCIIQDLLPLYSEGLTSPDSSEEIEKHLQSCEVCREVYEGMNAEYERKVEVPTDIEPLRKVRKRNLLKVILMGAVSAATAAVIILYGFVGIIPARSDKVETVITVSDEEYTEVYDPNADPKNGIPFDESRAEEIKRTEKMVTLKFMGYNGQARIKEHTDFEEAPNGHDLIGHYEITLYPLPFAADKDDTMFSLSCGVYEGSTITVHYFDKDITYSVTELAEKYGS